MSIGISEILRREYSLKNRKLHKHPKYKKATKYAR